MIHSLFSKWDCSILRLPKRLFLSTHIVISVTTNFSSHCLYSLRDLIFTLCYVYIVESSWISRPSMCMRGEERLDAHRKKKIHLYLTSSCLWSVLLKGTMWRCMNGEMVSVICFLLVRESGKPRCMFTSCKCLLPLSVSFKSMFIHDYDTVCSLFVNRKWRSFRLNLFSPFLNLNLLWYFIEENYIAYTMYLLVIFQQSSVSNQTQYVVHLLEMG